MDPALPRNVQDLLLEGMAAVLARVFVRLRVRRYLTSHVDAILRDLEWLGLAWDGEVTFQSQRLDRYQAALNRLKAMSWLRRREIGQ